VFSQCHIWPSLNSGEQNNAQLWNPAASGVRLKVSRLLLASAVGGGFNIVVSQEMAPELRNKGHGRITGPSAKCSAKAALRGAITTNWGQYQHYSLYVLFVPAGSSVSLAVEIVITPGYGLMAVGRGNHDLAASFDWTEETDT